MNLFGFSQFCTIIMLTLIIPSFVDSIKIKVEYSSKVFPVKLDKKDTVATLKAQEICNIRIQKQKLTKERAGKFCVERSADQKTIKKYAIGEGQNVFVSLDEFQFFVEYREKMYPIKVNAMTTIKEVKEKMTQITGIPSEKQTLIHYYLCGGFNDSVRLIDFVKEDMPFLIMSDGSGITVRWQNHWEYFVIYVNGTDTVATVKQKIREINKQRQKIRETNEQRYKSELNGEIILRKCHFDCEYGKALEDEKTMDEYGIIEGNDIHMKVLAWDEIWHESSPASSSAAAVADGTDFHIHMDYGSSRRTVWVKGTDKLRSLKDKIRPIIEADWKCKFGDISLFKHPFRVGIDELMDNEKTMDEYGIKEGDTIESLDDERLD
ncbi:hypothetical protein niasHS_018091 [Heterodera schachtii]|uniref:Ubiquitin-like domain-containing protein n=1 Tax=Heterodera schachtii TaxID=97005 RepID=A0ABD2HRT6_HETSC